MQKYSFKIATTCNDNNVLHVSSGNLVINKEVLAKGIISEILLRYKPSLNVNTLRYLDAINNLKENDLKIFVKHFIKINKTLHNALNSVYGRKFHGSGGKRVYSNYSVTKNSDIKTWDDYIVLDVDLFIDEYKIPVVYIGSASLKNFPLGGKLCSCSIGSIDYVNYLPNFNTFNKLNRMLYTHSKTNNIVNIPNNIDEKADNMNDYENFTVKGVNVKETQFNATILLERIIKLITKINDMVSLNTGTVSYGNITTTITNSLTLEILYTKNFIVKVKTHKETLLSTELNTNTWPIVEEFIDNFYYHQATTKITV